MAEFHKYGFSAIIPKPYRVMEAGKILHDVIMKNGIALPAGARRSPRRLS